MPRFISMRRCALGCASAVLLFSPAFGQDGKPDSVSLLSGLTVPRSINELPDYIEIPASWITAFKAAEKATDASGMEVGACLTIVAESRSEERQNLLRKYADLLKAQKLPFDGNMTAELRKLHGEIEEIGRISKSGMKFVVGKLQNGDENSVLIRSEGLECEGETVGAVHTHPGTGMSHVFSSQDFRSFVYHKDWISSAALNSGRMCMGIKTKDTQGKIGSNAAATSVAMNFSAFFDNKVRSTNRGISSGGNYHSIEPESLPGVMSATASRLGVGVYCGLIGERLKLINPLPSNPDERLFILMAKYALVAAKWSNPEKYKFNLEFALSSSLDDDFRNILKRALDGRPSSTLRPLELFSEMVNSVAEDMEIASNGSKATWRKPPSDDFEMLRYTFGCLLSDRGVSKFICGAWESTLSKKDLASSLAVPVASWDPDSDLFRVIDFEGDRFYLIEESKTHRFRGEAKRSGDRYIANGKGQLLKKDENLRIDGDWREGKFAEGEAIHHYLKSGEVWKVIYNGNGTFSRVQRINP